KSHLDAIRLVRQVKSVRVWSPRNAKAFAVENGVTASASAEEAIRGADIVVVATGSQVPVLMGDWLSPGVHVNAVGATRPDWRELDDRSLARLRVYVDSREAGAKESGDVIAAGQIDGEVGEVAAGLKPGRGSWEEMTLFKSVGLAVEDVVSAE